MFSSDVIWTAEFASQKWLYDMTPYVESRARTSYIPATLETVTYDEKYWGVPRTSDAAFLYYRTDKVKEVPATWQEVYDRRPPSDGIVYQGAAYEGLTCDFLEIAFAAGGKVLSEDGHEGRVRLARERQGAAVHGRRHQERRRAEGRDDLHGGGGAHRPSRAAARPSSATGRTRTRPPRRTRSAPEFEVAAVPGVRGRRQGRHPRRPQRRDLRQRQEPGRLARWCSTSSPTRQQHKILASEFSLPPAIASAYDDAEVKKALPFAAELKQAISQAKSRPVSPVYPQISRRSTRTSTRPCRAR